MLDRFGQEARHSFVLPEIRLARDNMIYPAQSTGTIKRPLRPLEQFDPFDIDEPDIRIGRIESYAGFVDLDRDGRLAGAIERAVRDTPYELTITPRAEIGQGKTFNRPGYLTRPCRDRRRRTVEVQRGYRSWNAEQILFTLLPGYDDNDGLWCLRGRLSRQGRWYQGATSLLRLCCGLPLDPVRLRPQSDGAEPAFGQQDVQCLFDGHFPVDARRPERGDIACKAQRHASLDRKNAQACAQFALRNVDREALPGGCGTACWRQDNFSDRD
ncbi:hypothetical protein PX699_21300 [Sphingobium sp. H39-3-25]|nr:hypothetical protein [Sphingobium arseniciresistens]